MSRKDLRQPQSAQMQSSARVAFGKDGTVKDQLQTSATVRDEQSLEDFTRDLCTSCSDHVGMERCYCGWSKSGGDGRRELVDMGETIDEDL